MQPATGRGGISPPPARGAEPIAMFGAAPARPPRHSSAPSGTPPHAASATSTAHPHHSFPNISPSTVTAHSPAHAHSLASTQSPSTTTPSFTTTTHSFPSSSPPSGSSSPFSTSASFSSFSSSSSSSSSLWASSPTVSLSSSSSASNLHLSDSSLSEFESSRRNAHHLAMVDPRLARTASQASFLRSVRVGFRGGNKKLSWDQYFEKVGPLDFSRCTQTRELVRRYGIPAVYRGAFWRILSSSDELRDADLSYHIILNNHTKLDVEIVEQIEKDLKRTFPDQAHFHGENAEGIQALRRVLTAYSCFDSDLGYCQSMNFIVALLLLFMQEEDAFWTLATIIQRFLPHDYYQSMFGVRVDIQTFCSLLSLRLPKVWSHLETLSVDRSIIQGIVLPWFLCLYVNVLPLESTLRFFDSFFFEGDKVLFRVALALFKIGEKALLSCSSMSDAIQIICQLPNNIDPDSLMDTAFDDGWLGRLTRGKIASLRSQHERELSEISGVPRSKQRSSRFRPAGLRNAVPLRPEPQKKEAHDRREASPTNTASLSSSPPAPSSSPAAGRKGSFPKPDIPVPPGLYPPGAEVPSPRDTRALSPRTIASLTSNSSTEAGNASPPAAPSTPPLTPPSSLVTPPMTPPTLLVGPSTPPIIAAATPPPIPPIPLAPPPTTAEGASKGAPSHVSPRSTSPPPAVVSSHLGSPSISPVAFLQDSDDSDDEAALGSPQTSSPVLSTSPPSTAASISTSKSSAISPSATFGPPPQPPDRPIRSGASSSSLTTKSISTSTSTSTPPSSPGLAVGFKLMRAPSIPSPPPPIDLLPVGIRPQPVYQEPPRDNHVYRAHPSRKPLVLASPTFLAAPSAPASSEPGPEFDEELDPRFKERYGRLSILVGRFSFIGDVSPLSSASSSE